MANNLVDQDLQSKVDSKEQEVMQGSGRKVQTENTNRKEQNDERLYRDLGGFVHGNDSAVHVKGTNRSKVQEKVEVPNGLSEDQLDHDNQQSEKSPGILRTQYSNDEQHYEIPVENLNARQETLSSSVLHCEGYGDNTSKSAMAVRDEDLLVGLTSDKRAAKAGENSSHLQHKETLDDEREQRSATEKQEAVEALQQCVKGLCVKPAGNTTCISSAMPKNDIELVSVNIVTLDTNKDGGATAKQGIANLEPRITNNTCETSTEQQEQPIYEEIPAELYDEIPEPSSSNWNNNADDSQPEYITIFASPAERSSGCEQVVNRRCTRGIVLGPVLCGICVLGIVIVLSVLLTTIAKNDQISVSADRCSTTLAERACHVNATCTNTLGSYNCTCNTGFVGNGTYCNAGQRCTLAGHTCHMNATCTNKRGSYNCTCNTGFVGNGTYCNASCTQFCQNGGTCTSRNTCKCPNSYIGDRCQTLLRRSLRAVSNKPLLVGYWGQNGAGPRFGPLNYERSLKWFCQNSAYDIINLAFLVPFFDSRNKDSLPGLNFAFHCGGGVSPAHPFLLRCPKIEEGIKVCQANKKTVLLSLGGAAANVGNLGSEQNAKTLAKNVWELFLGGTKMKGLRPFGTAILDGINLAIGFGRSHLYYPNFVTEIRRLMADDTVNNKTYLVTGAPRCVYPDFYLGPVKQGSALKEMPHLFDFLFVQFYNNPCWSGAGNEFTTVLSKWLNVSQANPAGPGILIGIPAGPGASSHPTYYRTPNELKTLYDGLRNKTGIRGIMLWDCSWDQNNVIDGRKYSDHVRDILDHKRITETTTTAPTTPTTQQPSSTQAPSTNITTLAPSTTIYASASTATTTTAPTTPTTQQPSSTQAPSTNITTLAPSTTIYASASTATTTTAPTTPTTQQPSSTQAPSTNITTLAPSTTTYASASTATTTTAPTTPTTQQPSSTQAPSTNITTLAPSTTIYASASTATTTTAPTTPTTQQQSSTEASSTTTQAPSISIHAFTSATTTTTHTTQVPSTHIPVATAPTTQQNISSTQL